MENIKLFNIPFEVQKAYEQLELDEETGEIKGFEEFQYVISQSKEKILGTVGLIKYLQSVETATTARIQELIGNRDALRKKQERLRQLVTNAMQGLKVQKLKDPIEGLSVSVQKRNAIVFSEDEDKINIFSLVHPDLTDVKITLRKIELKKAIKLNKDEIPDFMSDIVSVEPKQSLLIRSSRKGQEDTESIFI